MVLKEILKEIAHICTKISFFVVLLCWVQTHGSGENWVENTSSELVGQKLFFAPYEREAVILPSLLPSVNVQTVATSVCAKRGRGANGKVFVHE